MKFDSIRNQAYEANMALEEADLVVATFGNASALDSDHGVFAIKPSGVPYRDLSPELMVIVDIEGKKIDGDMNPSSDTLTHAVLYKEWPGIGGVVHTHSTYATAWAQAQMAIPIYGTTHADHLTVDIPCAPVMTAEMIKGQYEYMTGYQIVEYMAAMNYSAREVEMILVAGHAPFTWGKTVKKAVYNSLICEEIAKMAVLTQQIRPNAPRLDNNLIDKHYQRKHGAGAYYGQDMEK
ncbi:L-ribulose-5-phosphate 4-epimerase AraD [Membranihabitans marinus]|uniref:L-ribulose-5-phosphate 4-epimerase AraD n=1 Tax=Membranihabitans marinus TaxID=1227546 RepID=UPI001F1C23E1|nr:L-ribulose-5-phosphate 4-epimerase AraD [Membranihabitans marinus]